MVKPAESGEVAHESRASKNRQKPAAAAEIPALKPTVEFADFEKLDFRVGTVKACEEVPKSSKLLKFTLDCGSLGERTIFSGIRGTYSKPEELVGKQVLFIANLAPRKMSVGVSEGMILYAGEPGIDGGVLSPLAPTAAGTPAT
jgi:methionyl-tRNA synthetase